MVYKTNGLAASLTKLIWPDQLRKNKNQLKPLFFFFTITEVQSNGYQVLELR